jgi:NAD(P)-dependent dehydrogenase (short-subunit alcohol dehydrogenase family)
MKVEGCTALVTGGNRGIGQGFVEELVDAGARKVYVGSRNPDDIPDTYADYGDKIEVLQLDISNPDQVAAAAAKAQDVTLLVNNAGVFNMTTLMTAPTMDDMRSEMEVNFFGTMSMCRAFAPIIEQNGGGAIVNVLSAGGIVAVPNMGGYSPSKFAMRAASDCMRAELRHRNIHVAALIVGSVKTRMAAHIKNMKQALPRDIGKAGIFAVENNINEHDTDPHAVSVRAFLARDPHGLAESMAQRVAK